MQELVVQRDEKTLRRRYIERFNSAEEMRDQGWVYIHVWR